jgi:hypothetical protein
MKNDTERNANHKEPVFGQVKRQWQSPEIEEVDVANTEVSANLGGDGLALS